MTSFVVSLAGRNIAVECPASIAADIRSLFGPARRSASAPVGRITVREDGDGRFAIESRYSDPVGDLSRQEVPGHVLDEAGHSLIFDLDTAVALHAAAVLGRDGLTLLIAGPTGAGKSTLAAWLVENGMDYLADEIVLLGDKSRLSPFRRALHVKPGAREIVAAMSWVKRARSAATEAGGLIITPPPLKARQSGLPCRLILFPCREAGSGVWIESLSPAQATLLLMQCNLNARNLPDHGLDRVRELTLRTPAVRLRYGELDDLAGILDELIRIIDAAAARPASLHRLLSAFRAPAMAAPPSPPASSLAPRPIPAATPKRAPVKLTIGMATYDDYDGVYFTIQAIRLYHAECVSDLDFLVVDNNPAGPCGEALKDLETWIPNYRYVPRTERSGTAIRDAIFEEASGTYVLCLDCHVFLVPGALRRLLAYFDEFPETADIVHGPLLYDDLKSISTHFQPGWRGGMFGTWEKDDRGDDVDAAPFEIPMQGLGLFACRRDAWLGFNPSFRGFGGEEGYIHEKFRQAGRRAICLPFLRWMHRFARPMGVPYRNIWEDRIRNYVIGFTELGLPTAALEAHFKELIGEANAVRILGEIRQELGIAPPQ
jgi:hypothetical protein